MAIYYSVKCPHCNRVVESGANRAKRYGSPFRTCDFCGRTYVDNNYTEVGCLTDKEIKNRRFSWQSLIWILIGVTMICYGFVDSMDWWAVVGVVCFGIGVVSLISYLTYVPSNDTSLQLELTKSKERLLDPRYVVALWEVGSQVPSDLVVRAKNKIGYKEKADIAKEKMMDDDNYDKSRYVCKSYQYLSDAGKGKCMMCLHSSTLKKYKIKNEIGTREIRICDKCVNRFKEHNPNI